MRRREVGKQSLAFVLSIGGRHLGKKEISKFELLGMQGES